MRNSDARVRAAFASTSIDDDILDELAQHAESTYDELRADGVSEPDALARIDRLIDGWRTDPASLQRVVRRSIAVVPPRRSRSILSGTIADAIYGLRLLRAQAGLCGRHHSHDRARRRRGDDAVQRRVRRVAAPVAVGRYRAPGSPHRDSRRPPGTHSGHDDERQLPRLGRRAADTRGDRRITATKTRRR